MLVSIYELFHKKAYAKPQIFLVTNEPHVVCCKSQIKVVCVTDLSLIVHGGCSSLLEYLA